MRVIIAGSRTYNDYEKLKAHFFEFVGDQKVSAIISGTARGADVLGEKLADEYNYPIMRFPAAWKKFGKSAGMKRNKEMAEYGDALLAFWDGKSKGTASMIKFAHKKNLNVKVVRFDAQSY